MAMLSRKSIRPWDLRTSQGDIPCSSFAMLEVPERARVQSPGTRKSARATRGKPAECWPAERPN